MHICQQPVHLLSFCDVSIARLTECQFLQGTTECLRPQEVDAANFKGEPDDVADEVFPSGISETDWIDEDAVSENVRAWGTDLDLV